MVLGDVTFTKENIEILKRLVRNEIDYATHRRRPTDYVGALRKIQKELSDFVYWYEV